MAPCLFKLYRVLPILVNNSANLLSKISNPPIYINKCIYTTPITLKKLNKQELLKFKEDQQSFNEKRKAERQSPVITLLDIDSMCDLGAQNLRNTEELFITNLECTFYKSIFETIA